MVIYTTTLHEVRRKFGLTMNEYGVMDTVYRLSVNPKSPTPGWCCMSKPKIAKFFGIGRRTVFTILDRLEKKDLLQRKPESSHLRATRKWIDAVEPFLEEQKRDSADSALKGAKTAPPTVPNLHSEGADSALNNLSIEKDDKDKDMSDDSSPFGDYSKGNRKAKTAPDLVKLFHGLIGKQASGNGFKRDVGIVKNLFDRKYTAEELKEAIIWGVEKKGLMDLRQLPNVVNWHISERKRAVEKKKRELEGLDPVEYEAEQLGGKM